ncbi:aldehyde dehydrogenase family protein [Chloroflexia bacterium SDU3-3]|nr:aldehyde dehydrogenase family protein [Chloroflexia bacterium SDU3-3]
MSTPARTGMLLPTPTAAELQRLFQAQRQHRWAMAQTSPRERAERLQALRRAIVAHRAALHSAFQADFHKHKLEVDLLEIQPVLAEIDHAVAELGRWVRPRRARTPLLLAQATSEVRYEPKGVVLILGPWNYPVLLLLAPLVAAVAAGNCAILRPSEKVPRVALVLSRIIAEAFSQREVALVGGDVSAADALLRLPFDHFFFTGSTAVGKKVMQAAAQHMASVTLELGGKSPAIIDQTADLQLAAERVVWGKLINAGQTCVAPDYALVHESRYAAFLDVARATVARFYGRSAQARMQTAELPQIIDERAFERLVRMLRASCERGARVVLGGGHDAATRIIEPTLLADVAPDSPIMAEEIFGPILPVLPYRSLDDALALVNAREKPLALYIFSQSERAVEQVLRRTTAGGTVVNGTVVHLANPHLPFGGVGASGLGSYHGEHGFRAFSHERAVLRQSRRSFLPMFYPPYTARKIFRLRLAELFLYRIKPALRRTLHW